MDLLCSPVDDIAQVCDKAVSTSVRVADILFRAGCDVNQVTGRGRTPVILAMQQVRHLLYTWLLWEQMASTYVC